MRIKNYLPVFLSFFLLFILPQSGFSVKIKPVLSETESAIKKQTDFATPDWKRMSRKEIEQKLNRRLSFKERWMLRILKRTAKRKSEKKFSLLKIGIGFLTFIFGIKKIGNCRKMLRKKAETTKQTKILFITLVCFAFVILLIFLFQYLGSFPF